MTRTVLRGEDTPQATRAEVWADVISRFVYPMRLGRNSPDPAGHRIATADAGGTRVTEVATNRQSECDGVRDLETIRRDGWETCGLAFVQAGRACLSQAGHEADLGAGDLVINDLSRPSHWRSAGVRATLIFPPTALLHTMGNLRPLAGVRISTESGAASLAAQLIPRLPVLLNDIAPALRARLCQAALDVITVALTDELEKRVDIPPEARDMTLLVQIRSYIEQNLPDADLSPRSIAAQHHISLRYLYKLFEKQEWSVAEQIRHLRLERCRRDLLDPALRKRTIGAIAASWGFLDAAHFSRAFRRVYGLTPTEFRAATSQSTSALPDGEMQLSDPCNGSALAEVVDSRWSHRLW